MAEITAKKFMLFEDNEDGTSTVTLNLGEDTDGQDVTLLLPIAMEDILGIFQPGTLEEAAQGIMDKGGMVLIPSDPEGA